MYYVIDRIENFIAVCEIFPDGEKIEIDIKKMPSSVKEGDIIKYENGFVLDEEMTAARNTELRRKYNMLWNK